MGRMRLKEERDFPYTWKNFSKKKKAVYYLLCMLVITPFCSSIYVISYEIYTGINITKQVLWEDFIILIIEAVSLCCIYTIRKSNVINQYFGSLSIKKILQYWKLSLFKNHKAKLVVITTLYGTLFLRSVTFYSVKEEVPQEIEYMRFVSTVFVFLCTICLILPILNTYINKSNDFSSLFTEINTKITDLVRKNNEVTHKRLRILEAEYYTNWKLVEEFDNEIKYFIGGVFLIYFSSLVVGFRLVVVEIQNRTHWTHWIIILQNIVGIIFRFAIMALIYITGGKVYEESKKGIFKLHELAARKRTRSTNNINPKREITTEVNILYNSKYPSITCLIYAFVTKSYEFKPI
jgi:hypothetical protein